MYLIHCQLSSHRGRRVDKGKVSGGTGFWLHGRKFWLISKQYGDIVDIRFPSLKGNSHRRFCYVQFRNSSQANSATELHNEVVEGNLKLLVKISNPNRKNERSDGLSQGREIHIRNLHWAVHAEELEEICSKYGTVERARIPKNLSGKSKGFAFVTFSSKDEARKALDLDKTKIKDRVVMVEVATKNHANWKPTTIIEDAPRSSNSHSPDVEMTNVEGDDASSPIPLVNAELKPSLSEIHSRTLALLKLPDTVNSARVRALAEPYGPLVKIVLRHDHQGATIEYQNVADAGKAAIGLNGFEITPGRKIGVGSVAEMKKQEPEFKTSKIGGTGDTKSRSTPAALQSAFPIQRPNRPEKGRRGGLGIKRGGISHHVPKNQNENKKGPGGNAAEETPEVSNTQNDNKAELGGGEDEDSSKGKGKLPKSNEDFKAMFLKE